MDFSIFLNGQPQILIECKWWGENLDVYGSQLFKYFHTTKAKFSILTNGITYRFYTDLIDLNKMDEEPFLDFDITNMKEVAINELKKFHKSYLDVGNIVSSASELKYSNEIKNIMNKDLNEPSPDFVKFFVWQVYLGQAKEKVMIQFTGIVKKTLNQLVSDIISDMLKTVIDIEKEKNKPPVVIEDQPKSDEPKVITTKEELEAFYIVKAILMP